MERLLTALPACAPCVGTGTTLLHLAAHCQRPGKHPTKDGSKMPPEHTVVNRSATDQLARLIETELARQGLNGEQAAREARLPAAAGPHAAGKAAVDARRRADVAQNGADPLVERAVVAVVELIARGPGRIRDFRHGLIGNGPGCALYRSAAAVCGPRLVSHHWTGCWITGSGSTAQ